MELQSEEGGRVSPRDWGKPVLKERLRNLQWLSLHNYRVKVHALKRDGASRSWLTRSLQELADSCLSAS